MSCKNGHPADQVEIRKKPGVSGTRFVRQCQACGRQVGGTVPLERVPDPRVVPRWNQRLAHRPQPTARKRAYAERFKRADWRRLRSRVLERDNWTCRSCGGVATEVHHLTYERFGEERPSDLVAYCAACNQAEREERIAHGAQRRV